MDYVTRQFINLAKHFRKDLRKSLTALNSALQKQTEAISKSYQVNSDKHSPSPEVTVFNNLPRSIEIHQNEKNAKDERNYKRFMFLVTTMTLGAIVIYADLVYWQYREMINATNASQQSAAAASVAAGAANETLKANERHFRIEERPYVSIEDMRFDPPLEQSHQPALVKWAFRNSGKTPALQGTFDADGFVDRVKTSQLPRDFAAPLTIPSDRAVTTSMNIWINVPGDFEAISKGTKKLSIKGTLRYTDIFGDWHPTTFCGVYDAKVNKGWVYCPGNDVK